MQARNQYGRYGNPSEEIIQRTMRMEKSGAQEIELVSLIRMVVTWMRRQIGGKQTNGNDEQSQD